MATPQCPRAGRRYAGPEGTRGSSASSQGSKVSSPMRTDMVEVRGGGGRGGSSVVCKTVSYAQALKMNKADSTSSSKLNSPCPTPSESPYQSKVLLQSGTVTPSGSVQGVSSPAPSVGDQLPSPGSQGKLGAKVSPIRLEEVETTDVHTEEVEDLVSPVSSPLVSPSPSPAPPVESKPMEEVMYTQPRPPPPATKGVSPPTPGPHPSAVSPTLKDTSPGHDKLTSDPVVKDTPLVAMPTPLAPPPRLTGMMRVPPGLPIPLPAHTHNLTDHQKLLTQQQKLLVTSRPYTVGPGRLATGGSVLPMVQPLMPRGHHLLEQQQQRQQQQGLLEHQSRLMKGQDIPYHLSSHTHLHSGPNPSLFAYPMPSRPTAIQANPTPKPSVLHTPVPLPQATATRPLLGNQTISPELLLHLMKQPALQKHAFLMPQQVTQLNKGLDKVEPSPVYSQTIAQQIYQPHPTVLPASKPEVLSMAPYLLPNTHLSTPLGTTGQPPAMLSRQTAPPHNVLPAQPAPPLNIAPGQALTIPHGQTAPQVYAPMVRVNYSVQQQPLQQRAAVLTRVPADSSPPSQAPPTGPGLPAPPNPVRLEANVELSLAADESEIDENADSLKPSSLSVSATPFIPMAQDKASADSVQLPAQSHTQQSPVQHVSPPQHTSPVQQLAAKDLDEMKKKSQEPHPHPPPMAHPPAIPHPRPSHPPSRPPSFPPTAVQQAPLVYPAVGGGRGIPANIMAASNLMASVPQQRKLREEQAYQVITPEQPHRSLHQLPAAETSHHLKDNTRYRVPAHMAGEAAGLIPNMEVRAVPPQKPFAAYGLPAATQLNKLIVGGAREPLVTRTVPQGQQEVAINVLGVSKRALLPTPSHGTLLPPHIPPTQSWTMARGNVLPSAHSHSNQQVVYPEQRNMPGYTTGAGPGLLGVAYHRTQI